MGQLTLAQRYKIEALKQQGFKQNKIAEAIDCDKSVVSRELKRNCDLRNGSYRAELAHKKCLERHRTKNKKIRFTAKIKQDVDYWLKEDYSPEQIVGVAKLKGDIFVSCERIYQYIWADKKSGGKLYKHLRAQGKYYRKRGIKKDKRGQIQGRIGIENRPKEVEEKARFGDLEMDLVIGKNHKKAILTINDRATGMAKIALLENKSSQEVNKKAIEVLKEWKPYLHTITSDNGKEFALHKEISKSLEINYFFANPYHSWERGANENFNKLLRQYFPKNIDFKTITQEKIKQIEKKLNDRPRKRFGYLSPKNYFCNQILTQTKVAFIT
jgi:IS30 family transposase